MPAVGVQEMILVGVGGRRSEPFKRVGGYLKCHKSRIFTFPNGGEKRSCSVNSFLNYCGRISDIAFHYCTIFLYLSEGPWRNIPNSERTLTFAISYSCLVCSFCPMLNRAHVNGYRWHLTSDIYKLGVPSKSFLILFISSNTVATGDNIEAMQLFYSLSLCNLYCQLNAFLPPRNWPLKNCVTGILLF